MKKTSIVLAVISVLALAGPASAKPNAIWRSKSGKVTLLATHPAQHRLGFRFENHIGYAQISCKWHEVSLSGDLVQRHFRATLLPQYPYHLRPPRFGPDATDFLPTDASCNITDK
jgi:hypothetical protein